ncbi:MAG TPA: carbon-phosphorus lyase complex subunit PhnI [Devosia sp.]|nr:carbon-phosphorus lyase complex subunit PhnI [Devosia sp.]
MAYVAARGGERAIEQAERLYRRDLGPITRERVDAALASMPLLIDRIMGEASLYSRELAALALVQSGGDLYEALLLLRSYRTTQPRIAVAQPASQDDGITFRRISASFKDIPGGQILGPTLDYAHRLLNVDVLDGIGAEPLPVDTADRAAPPTLPSLADWQRANGLVATLAAEPAPTPEDIPDITREPLLFPASRAHKLQSLARADTGGMLSLAYATMRGYGSVHPTVNELRLMEIDVEVPHPAGFTFKTGRVRVSQAEIVSKVGGGTAGELKLGFTASFGWNEIKAIAGATLDLAMDQPGAPPAAEEEFVLYHTEAIEASGFCLHFKLPHYVTFQSSLDAIRKVQADRAAAKAADEVPAEAFEPEPAE